MSLITRYLQWISWVKNKKNALYLSVNVFGTNVPIEGTKVGWFSNRMGTSVDDCVSKSNSWIDQWQPAANWVPEVEFSPFRALTRRQMTFPSCCWISLLFRDGTAILHGYPSYAKGKPLLGKGSTFISQLLKKLSICPAQGIEPATSRSAVKLSTDWAPVLRLLTQ